MLNQTLDSPTRSFVRRRGLSLLLLASLVMAGSASRDITDIPGILSDLKTSLTTLPTESDFENAYQQYAELLAPVALLMAGGKFEVCGSSLSASRALVTFSAGL